MACPTSVVGLAAWVLSQEDPRPPAQDQLLLRVCEAPGPLEEAVTPLDKLWPRERWIRSPQIRQVSMSQGVTGWGAVMQVPLPGREELGVRPQMWSQGTHTHEGGR